MADEEQLRILREGVKAWNAWREEHADIGANLSRADLSRADLEGANFADAILREADLREARLIQADLSGSDLGAADVRYADLRLANLRLADLRRANLRNAKLNRADVSWANLAGANLTKAYLCDTNLSAANLTETDLREANLSGATLRRTILAHADMQGATLAETAFVDVDLSRTKGLNSSDHHRDSGVDHRTLLRSGPLPLAFLRGVGLPEALIDYLPSLLQQPIQYFSCFISYASADEDFAKRLHADLQDHGVRCWFAPEDMKIGDKIRARLDEVVRIHDKSLIVLSETSVASDWVEKEVSTAFEQESNRGEAVLFPIRVDDAVMDADVGWAADIKRTRYIGDFTQWKQHDVYQRQLEKLLGDLKPDKQ